MQEDWLLDETRPLNAIQAKLEVDATSRFQTPVAKYPLAVAIRDVRIHDVKRLFGSARIRLDALFVTVPAVGAKVTDLYSPQTFRFDGVRDGDRLPIDNTMLLYLGQPTYFLDISIAASRDEGDTPDLAEALSARADRIADTLSDVGDLAKGLPVVGGVTAAASAAVQLSSLVLGVLSDIAGKSIGLYRNTWYENRDKFGLGHHPSDGLTYRKNDLEFRYEIFRDAPVAP